MALLWMDGFDHYGTDESQMLDGVWAEVASGATLQANARTGAYAIRLEGGAGGGQKIRRIFGAAKTKVGIAEAVYIDSLPTNNYMMCPIRLVDGNNKGQVSLWVTTTGALSVYNGIHPDDAIEGGNLLGTSADGTVTASAYQHIEMLTTCHATTGAVEVRVNGVTVLTLSNVNTNFTGTGQLSQYVAQNRDAFAPSYYIDDLFAYDDTGAQNNGFMGDLRVKHIMPNDDTAQADWLKSTGSTGYTLIDEIPANDDTDYIYNEAFGDGGEVSEFQLENLVGAIASIRGVQTYAKQRKTVAGTCNTEVSLVSGTSVSLGADRPITEEYTYWMDVHERDPATGAPWTKDAINAMKLRIERTA